MRRIFIYLKIYNLAVILQYFFLETKMLFRQIFHNSYSQWGEDIIIDNLLGKKNTGFYVDVGAYDPTRFSNTKRFYLRGWSGINIEPDPTRIKKFYSSRPRDINLNIGIANVKGIRNFFIFEQQTLSTFSKNTAMSYQMQGYPLRKTIRINVFKLGEVLEKNFKGKEIDFFSIDTEGFDYEVLKSNNWKKFRPKIICIERQNKNINMLLAKLNYKKVFENRTNAIFKYSS
jgi:FkbM family methyltransferase